MSQTTNSRQLSPQNTPFKSSYQPTSRTSITFPEMGKTKQAFKDECDVNTIMARYAATGELPNINALPPQYLDVTEMDFQYHQNFLIEAQNLFNQLPSSIRSRFENSPGQFLDFVSNPDNRPELTKMGLARPIADPVIPMGTLDQTNAPTGSKTS